MLAVTLPTRFMAEQGSIDTVGRANVPPLTELPRVSRQTLAVKAASQQCVAGAMQTRISSTAGIMLSFATLSCPATFTLANEVIHQAKAGSSIEAWAAHTQVIFQLAEIPRVPRQTEAHSPPLVRATGGSILTGVDIARVTGEGELAVISPEAISTEALVG